MHEKRLVARLKKRLVDIEKSCIQLIQSWLASSGGIAGHSDLVTQGQIVA